jgi:hypothetical protein
VHHFLGSVVVFGHESEKVVEEVVRRFWQMFEDFVRNCIRSGGFTGRRSVARGGEMVFCEVVV